MRRDREKKRTLSQTSGSNLKTEGLTVGHVLEGRSPIVFSITPEESLGDAVVVLRDKGIGALVVTDADGALCGILSERDIVRKLADTPGQTLPQKVGDVMTEDVKTCSPNDTVVSVLQTMNTGRFRHMPVTDPSGLIGMITIGDVVGFRLSELEHETLQLKQLIVG
ncbi:MAG: CBS domain-containing protein [Pseudomonadota bacterium]